MADWRDRAACLDEDPELFFPVGKGEPSVRQATQAKAVCRRCPVMESCLRWALDRGEDAGIWGGLDPDERRAFRRWERQHGRVGVFEEAI